MNYLLSYVITNWTYFTFGEGRTMLMATLIALVAAIVVFKVVLNALSK